MNEPHSIGAAVKQRVPVITGTVSDVRYDAPSKSFQSLVGWSDETGDHSRWFSDSDLEAAPAAEAVETVGEGQ